MSDASASPLPPAAFFVLFALAGGDKHGYAIMKEARELSNQRVRMGAATLYTTVQRLVESGWIAEVKAPENADPRRRYYSLTVGGRKVFEEELLQMEALVRKSRAMRLRPAEAES